MDAKMPCTGNARGMMCQRRRRRRPQPIIRGGFRGLLVRACRGGTGVASEPNAGLRSCMQRGVAGRGTQGEPGALAVSAAAADMNITNAHADVSLPRHLSLPPSASSRPPLHVCAKRSQPFGGQGVRQPARQAARQGSWTGRIAPARCSRGRHVCALLAWRARALPHSTSISSLAKSRHSATCSRGSQGGGQRGDAAGHSGAQRAAAAAGRGKTGVSLPPGACCFPGAAPTNPFGVAPEHKNKRKLT